ncbi:mobile element transfer protein [Streptantibioticus rubrisoli]|uniref:Mobile element transfer n=1 Tax=Streptantibioticus rubrisoli TaxID=1387313 RepID=A0ABT1PEV7_9ACTN|nr:mobile element transfer protein [Streptantibioticus rubrisoli]MCQ4043008.1 Mobile element transfer [Streptantibioticus rubrisoli]
MAAARFWDLFRIGPVEIATHRDRYGRTAHVAACTAPGCDWSADYLNRFAAELAARTHRCAPR